MPEYDASIRIGTEISSKDAEKELKSLAGSITKTAEEISSLRSKMNSLKDVKIPTQAYKDIQAQIAATEAKIANLGTKQEKFLATGGSTDSSAYKRMQYELDELRQSLPFLKDELQDFVETGKDFTLGSDTEEYSKMSAQLQQLNQKMQCDLQRQSELQSALNMESQRLVDIKKNATVSDQGIIEALERRKRLQQEINDLEKAGVGLGYKEHDDKVRELEKLNSAINDYKKNLSTVPQQFERMKNSAKKAFTSVRGEAKKSGGVISSFASRIKSIAVSAFIFNGISKAFSAMVSGMKTGFENLMNYSSSYANSIQGLKNAMATLGNQLAAAFAPIVQMVIPWLTSLVSAISTAIEYVSRFFAVLTGKKSYTRAKKVQTSYGESLGTTAKKEEAVADAAEDAADSTGDMADEIKDSGKAAEKASGSLAAFDDIDVLSKKDSGVEDAAEDKKLKDKVDKIEDIKDAIDDLENGAGGGGGVGDLFEEVPIDNEMLEGLEAIMEILGKFFYPFKESWNREGDFVLRSWQEALSEIWKLMKDMGRDFLIMWGQDETVRIFSNLLHVAGDIGAILGNIVHAIDIAWNSNRAGLNILEDIRDIFDIIIQHIRDAADETVSWSKTLDLRDLLKAIDKFLKSVSKAVEGISDVLLDFYKKVMLPLSKWVLKKGLPDLLDVMTKLSDSVKWDKIKESFSTLDTYLLEVSEFTFDALIDFLDEFLVPIASWTMNEALPFLVDTLTDLLDKIDWSLLNEALETLWNGLSRFVIGVGDGLINFFEGIEPFVTTFIAETIHLIAKALEFIGNIFNEMPSEVIEAVGGAIAGVLTAFVTYKAIDATIGGVSTALHGLSDAFKLLAKHPFAVIVGGIAAIAGAIISLNQSAQERREIEMFGEKLDDINQKVQNRAKEIEQWQTETMNYVSTAGVAEILMAEDLYERYHELEQQEHRTNAETEEMRGLASKLVETLPDLKTYYDEQTGYLNITGDALQRVIDKRLAEIRISALEDKISEAYKQQADNLIAMEEPLEAANRATEIMNGYQKDLARIAEEQKLLYEWVALEKQIKDCDGSTEELIKRQQEIEGVLSHGGERFVNDGLYHTLQDDIAKTNQKMQDFNDEYNQVMQTLADSVATYEATEETISKLMGMLTEGYADAANAGIDEYNNIISNDTSMINATDKCLNSVTDRLKQTMPKEFEAIASYDAEGFSNKISKDTSMVKSTYEQSQDILKRGAAEPQGINSPSKKFREFAYYDIEGFVIGINENAYKAIDVLEKLCASMFKVMYEDFVKKTADVLIGMHWRNAWDNAGNIFSGFKGRIDGIISSLQSMLQSFFEWIKTSVSDALAAIESLRKEQAANTAGASGSVVASNSTQRLSVPQLATGAVIRGGNPFMAILGDQPSGQTNIEAPLNTIKQAVREELAGLSMNAGSGQPVKIVLNLDGTEIGEVMLDDLFSVMNRRGYDVGVLGVN